MPTYVYRCKKGHEFELFHSISDESRKRCPKCRSGAVRVPAGGSGLLFKGSGFYITDYGKDGKKDQRQPATDSSKSESSGSGSESSTKSSDKPSKSSDKPPKGSGSSDT